MAKAAGGSRSSRSNRELGITQSGETVYEIKRFSKFTKMRGGDIAVGTMGEYQGKILYAGGASGHWEVIKAATLGRENENNFVRFVWSKAEQMLFADTYGAASRDPDTGLRNIYKATSRLMTAGVPGGTTLMITKAGVTRGAIITTVGAR